MNGIFNIDKPSGWTSHDVVARVRRITGQKRVGHAGTLDPLATGVLPVVLGTATRLVEYLADADKAYRATMVLGATTDTYDREGTLTPNANALMPPREEVETALGQFRGEIEQLPPMHSAIKVGGKKLYELARQGIEVERQPRKVTISNLQLEAYRPPTLQIFVECSKGTYIRSLAHDLGTALGTGAYLDALIRTRHGPFTLEGAVTLEGLEAAFRGGTWQESLYSPEYILADWKCYITTPEEERDLMQGKPLRLDAPQDGERPMMVAKTPHEELLAVLYWDGEREVWQPKKVFISSSEWPPPSKEKQQSSAESDQTEAGTDIQIDWRDDEQFIEALQDTKTFVGKYAPIQLEMRAGRLLRDQGDTRVIQPLIRLAQDKSLSEIWRREAIAVSGHARITEAVEALIHILNDETDTRRIRCWAAITLGEIGDKQAVEPLLTLLSHRQKEVRSASIKALGDLGAPEAVEPVIGMLVDLEERKSLRHHAAITLGKIGDTRAINPLVTILLHKSNDKRLRSAAAMALGSFNNQGLTGPLLTILQDQDEDNELRTTVLQSLRKSQAEGAIPIFLDLAKDDKEHGGMRGLAIGYLGELHAKEAINKLIAVLMQDEDAKMRSTSAYALGEIGGSMIVEPLINALSDAAPDVRSAAASALGKTGDLAAVEPLLNVLVDEDFRSRYSAAEALGELRDVQAMEPLRHALLHDNEICGAAAVALGKLGDNWAFDKLIELIKGDHGDNCVCAHAAEGLGWLGDPRAVEPLIAELTDYEWVYLRRSAVEALGRIGDARALLALKEAYKHDADYVREAMREAIQAIEERQQAG